MKIEYTRFFKKLKENKINQKDFRESAKISAVTMQRMLHNESITTDSICKICDFFYCMPDEIMEFIPEPYYEEKRQAKANIESQIAELQAKLKQI